jgi:hypothetical protein
LNKELVKTDQIQKMLGEAGFDLDKELLALDTTANGFEIPRIRIEHKDNGRHRLYIDYGENYLGEKTQEEPIPENCFEAVVFAEQHIRALWSDTENLPACSGIDGQPTVPEPVNDSCLSCKESVISQGNCRPKIRLWLLVMRDNQIKPFVLSLSPTSIKHWNQHKRKLKRSKLPVVAVNTVFKLEDIKKNSYRWAEVIFDINGIATVEILTMAKQARDELNRIMQDITARDFDDPGDKQ